MIGGLQLGEIALVALATLLASLVSGIGGFGGGFVIAIALTPIVGVKALLPLISVFALCSNISRFIIYRQSIEWRSAIIFSVSSAPGVVIGTNFFESASERILLGILGVTLISCIPVRRYFTRHSIRPGNAAFVVIGFLFGILSGTSVGSGLFVIATLSGSGLQNKALLGTDAIIGLANSFMRVISFWSLGMLPTYLIFAGVIMGIMTLPGTLLARKAVEMMGEKVHAHLIELLILAGGLYFLYSSITYTAA